MKTHSWIILLALALVLCLGLSAIFLMPRNASTHAQIISDGVLQQTLDLRVEQEFTVTTADGGTNLITVKNGRIAVTEATCPDHYCMNRGFCDGGAQIVCLPNRLVLKFVGTQEVDAVVV